MFMTRNVAIVYRDGWNLSPSDSPLELVVATCLNEAGTKVRTEGGWDPDTGGKDTGQGL
jgi:hypothetical protein